MSATPLDTAISNPIAHAIARGRFELADYLLRSSDVYTPAIDDLNLAAIIDYNSTGLSNQECYAWERVEVALNKEAKVEWKSIRQAIGTGNVDLVKYLWNTAERPYPKGNNGLRMDVKRYCDSGDMEAAVVSGNRDMVEYVYKNSRENSLQLTNASIIDAIQNGDDDHVKYVVELYGSLNSN